jgi:hypothetical protein
MVRSGGLTTGGCYTAGTYGWLLREFNFSGFKRRLVRAIENIFEVRLTFLSK